MACCQFSSHRQHGQDKTNELGISYLQTDFLETEISSWCQCSPEIRNYFCLFRFGCLTVYIHHGSVVVSGVSSEDLTTFAQKFLSDGTRVKPYFWQYNAQSRGPKAQRLCNPVQTEDSHVVPDFSDPVFCADLPYQLSHNGKARQGDGNDPRPDPQKLLAIGCHIWRLETYFKAVSVESAAASSSRSATNQRKNQLASKICRLKKKALHAANKIKLDGLKQEHGKYVIVCVNLRDLLLFNPLKPSVIRWLHFKCSVLLPCRPNLPFLVSDIWALSRSGLSSREPECQKLKMIG